MKPAERQCVLCERDVPSNLITLHHLRPKSRGGTADDRVPLCRTCHKQIHATFDNRTLERSLASVTALRTHPLMEPFMRWIVKQSPGRDFRTRVTTQRRRR